jgi:RNA polymerase sigma factor (sigma-70 family)
MRELEECAIDSPAPPAGVTSRYSSTSVAATRFRPILARMRDEWLVKQLREDNEVAYEVLVDRHLGALLSYCRLVLGPSVQAEEAMQDTFRRRINHLTPRLFTVARHRRFSTLRSRREVPSAELPERASHADLANQVEASEEVRQLLDDLGDLPLDQRAALLLVETRALSHKQVARALGYETKQVKALVSQARAHLVERREARKRPNPTAESVPDGHNSRSRYPARSVAPAVRGTVAALQKRPRTADTAGGMAQEA